MYLPSAASASRSARIVEMHSQFLVQILSLLLKGYYVVSSAYPATTTIHVDVELHRGFNTRRRCSMKAETADVGVMQTRGQIEDGNETIKSLQ